ncbi:MAG TPA: DNA repair protein RadC [Alphaproteobacteria bacterium]
MTQASEQPHYTGHRQRLKGRFVDAGPDTLADYELLEVLLFAGIPRRDVKPLAKDLIKRFTFEGVFAADVTELQSVPGMTESAAIILKSVEAVSKRLAKKSVLGQTVLSSWQRLLDYCHTAMAREKREHFRVLYMNKRNVLMADEVHQVGTVDQSAVYPREIIKRALDLGATALILAHNHPSGDPAPSDADIELTESIIRAGDPLGIVVHDHLIIAKTGHVSFKNLGLI